MNFQKHVPVDGNENLRKRSTQDHRHIRTHTHTTGPEHLPNVILPPSGH